MKGVQVMSDKQNALRVKAEQIIVEDSKERNKDIESLSVMERQALVHELRVHQIELELQNDELRRIQRDLEKQMQRYRELYDLAPIGYLSLDSEGKILRANLYAATLLGDVREALIGRSLNEFVVNEDQDTFYLFARQYDTAAKRISVELRFNRADGTRFWAKLDTAGTDEPAIGIIMDDISARRDMEARLRLAANVFTHAGEAIMITDPDATIVDVNRAFERITGYSKTEILGKNPNVLSSGRHSKVYYQTMWTTLLEKGYWSGEIWNRHKNEEIFVEMLTISAVPDDNGKTLHYVALFFDITQIKEHEDKLQHIAQHDGLTGLPNRVLLSDRLGHAMAQVSRHKQMLAVVYLDLDSFKDVNDNYGHDVGDQLLISLSKKMQATLRKGDTLARIGGDEFVLVLVELDSIENCIPMINRLLQITSEQIEIKEHRVGVSASLGVSFYPQVNELDTDQLLRQADQAMYEAKVSGKNRYRIFDEAQNRVIQERYQVIERLYVALEQQEFVLYYQPKVNMRSGELIGAEALIRWQHPEKGLLGPESFLGIIAEHPLSVKIGEWVIASALEQIEKWSHEGLDIKISVNVGARQLEAENFPERLAFLLAEHSNVSPSQLEIEILETVELSEIERMSQVIHECKRLGVSFALDDFGTGYSSLSYLQQLPVDIIKIDQRFIRETMTHSRNIAILEGIIGIAAAFNHPVIAEGVETVEHGNLLLELGCELAQGYAIARPMPSEALIPWHATWKPESSWGHSLLFKTVDMPLRFARLEHMIWIDAAEAYLKNERADFQNEECQECRFGMWLGSKSALRYANDPSFEIIKSLHREIHEQIAIMIQLHTDKEEEKVLQQMPRLHQLRDKLLCELEQLSRFHIPEYCAQ
jgi:diguanylate cyclase (GGDEF)-like protein/PAS domain S-box-containing protein